jgi:2-dehydropantoate 2-reductase
MTASNRIGVVGAGPVGSIVTAYLARAGREILLVECGDRLAQIRQHGISVGGVGSVEAQHPTLLQSVDELAGAQLQALFICTKAWSLKSLLPALAKALDPGALIVSFQNGVGPEEEIAAHFERRRVCRGIVNFAGGISASGDTVNMLWFTPPNYLGSLEDNGGESRELAYLLTSAGLTSEAVSSHEVKKKVFFKTILNAALSALCASTGITMRRAMQLRHTRSLAQTLIREGLSVASAVGYSYGETSMDYCLRYLDAGGDHLPSMWVDLDRGLPTEIEYINGRIVQLGTMFRHVDVSANAFLTSMIVTLEIKSGVRKPEDIPEYLTHS